MSMPALRRIILPRLLRNRCLGFGIAPRACRGQCELPYFPVVFDPKSPSIKRFYYQDDVFSPSSISKCGFSSQADGSTSETEISYVDGGDDGEFLESESGLVTDQEREPSDRAQLELFKAIVADLSVEKTLEKWTKDGKDLNRCNIWIALHNLHKLRMFGRALQLSEWVEKNGKLDFMERDYACRVDLIANVRGLRKAEIYIDEIPESFRGEIVYETFLAKCVSSGNVRKAEEVFNKMRDMEFPITAFACNQLLLLYKKFDKYKITDVLQLMEEEDVKPTVLTYRLLIDSKGLLKDLKGMELIVEAMKAEGFGLDIDTQATLARHYAYGGQKTKAESVLKDMEGGDLKEHRFACHKLLPLYAMLGKEDEVKRVWEVCEDSPQIKECLAAIKAWGMLKKVEEAEAVFDRMTKMCSKLSTSHLSFLLKVYANNKMFSKGKSLVKRMVDSGCWIGPRTWHDIIKLYVEAGEVERAEAILYKTVPLNLAKPTYITYMHIMKEYAKRGDVHSAERIFRRMRLSGYMEITQFQSLLQAYVNAKTPAYGMRERMKADNIFPGKLITKQLLQVDPFKRSSILDIDD